MPPYSVMNLPKHVVAQVVKIVFFDHNPEKPTIDALLRKRKSY